MDYTQATTEEQRAIFQGRLRQLELEHAGHKMLLAETKADPHAGEAQVGEIEKAIQSTEARISAVKAGLDSFPVAESAEE